MDKRRCKRLRSFSVWGGKFWRGFFHPRHKGLFLVLFLTLISFAFTLVYIVLGVYFETFCKEHEVAYLLFFVSNVLYILAGVVFIHFLTLVAGKLTIGRCFMIGLGLVTSAIFSIAAIILFSKSPTQNEMKTFIVNFFRSNNRVPRIQGVLQSENKCCGVSSYKDFAEWEGNDKGSFRLLPDSCCKVKAKDCGNFRGPWFNETNTTSEIEGMDRFYLNGCFVNSNYKDLRSLHPKLYYKLQLVYGFTFVNLFLIVVLFSIYSYYICYELKHEDEEPDYSKKGAAVDALRRLSHLRLRRSSHHHSHNRHRSSSSSAQFEKFHEHARPKLSSFSSATPHATNSSVSVRHPTSLRSHPSESLVEINIGNDGVIIIQERPSPSLTPSKEPSVTHIPSGSPSSATI